MNENLRRALRQLRLSGLADCLEVRLQEAAGHQLNHAEFLELVLQDELLVRADRLIQRRVKAAVFRKVKPLETFYPHSTHKHSFCRKRRSAYSMRGSLVTAGTVASAAGC